ncbi:type I glutamate--ammonia ligase [Methanofollis aquaemaris]|uniref:Glutamine synthetase n=1 Tax=Methanofollis aquaemaris TaxID=126734 RepID=A0A8A3S5H9_9EURY|nr:glutamine synthetase beta-grasp domain-containing protein [Methanofollis aquaemaris]QSZ66886.1 type I glutamate--ammonia ligase [Methanofollis aquaemaris]
MPADEVTALLERIKADNVKFIRLQFSDLQGQPKNVAIPPVQAEKALTDGISFDGSSIEGFARIEESDMVLKPDMATYTLLPWRKEEGRVARFICDVHLPDKRPFEGDPRQILKKVVADAARDGYEFNTGPELEFFLFKMINGRPSLEFQDHGGYFDLAPTDLAENVRRAIVLALTEMGFVVEASHHEVAKSQHEIDFKYGPALQTADNVVSFKFATKTIALMNDLHATFMAKPIYGINGSGMHTNCSLFKDGENVFYDPDAPRQLSETALHFIGGVLKHIRGITRIANPTINSYKRLVPGYEAPVYISWSASNRTALCRVPSPRGKSTRMELRSPDPTCNAYLTFAVILAAGMDGVRNRIEPPASADQNIFELSNEERQAAGIDTLPDNLLEANEYLLKDELLCSVLGNHVVENLTRLTEMEWDSYRSMVHPWEVEHYFYQH